ncbi:MFS transporter [Leekyejoonella antrihumi]|uniref:MFS transporter n=1 Tax=Leekyejoonella antrihumi TaxID=1660198 RepID=A0A563E0R5_9MICO|nr:MFS transporter [Leekyejoonella antrihumi]
MLGHERARPDWVRRRSNAWWFAVGTVCFGAFMGQLDASIVTLTYGSLGRQFGASLAGIQWVSLSYLIVLAALLVPLGRLSDAHGRKLFYLYGFAVFTLASVACGLAWSLTSLIAFRVLQAVGAGLLQANSVALVVTSAPRAKMRTALGVQAGAQALGLALGPTVGGLLVSTIGWRWVFGINAPVGVLGVLAGIYFLPRTRARHPGHQFDWSGVVLLATVTTAVLMALSVFSGLPWPAWTAFVLLAAALACAALMIRRQSRVTEPLVATAVLKTPGLLINLAGALFGYLVLFGPLVLVPVAFEAQSRSAFSAGLVLTALPVGFALAALGLDKALPRHWSNARRAVVGALLCATSLAAMLTAPGDQVMLPVTLAFLGLGLGIFTPANNALVMGRLASDSSGTGGGLINMGRSVGTALGVALVTITWQLTDTLSDPARFRAVVLVLLVVALATIATSGGRQRLESEHAA